MSILAGKVYMQGPDGSHRFVPPDRVEALKARGAKVVPVHVRKTMPSGNVVDRTLPGDYGAQQDRLSAGQRGIWARDEGVEVVEPGQPSRGTPALSALGNNFMQGAGDVVANAPAAMSTMIPGVGWGPMLARAAVAYGGGTPAQMAGQFMRGEEVDPTRATTTSALGTILGLPFEAGAALLPRQGPRILSDVLRPRSKRQMELQKVIERQTGVSRTPADYEAAGKDMARERLRPSMEAEATLIQKGEATNQGVDDILDQATAAGHDILPTTLARSPEIAALRKEAAKEMDPASARKTINAILKAFIRGRSTPGTANVQPRPTGVLDAQGNMVMTPFKPGVPARQKPISPKRLASPDASDVGQKQVWRREANVINKARDAGTSTDKVQGMEARVSDALARAAKRHVEGLPYTTADPENAGAQIGAAALNERLERRIPLEAMNREFNMRPPLSTFERYGLLRGRLPISEAAEGGLGLAFSDPRFALDLLGKGRGVTGIAAQDVTSKAINKRRP